MNHQIQVDQNRVKARFLSNQSSQFPLCEEEQLQIIAPDLSLQKPQFQQNAPQQSIDSKQIQNQMSDGKEGRNFNFKKMTNNLLSLPKRYRQLGVQGIKREQVLKKLSRNANVSLNKSHRQADLESTDPNNQFKRTKQSNHRRSLHFITRQFNDKSKDSKNDDLRFVKKSNKIISHQNTQRRYEAQDKNYCQSQNEINRPFNQHTSFQRGRITSMNDVITQLYHQKNQSRHNRSLHLTNLEEEIIFNRPQMNSKRMVVFLKTYILSNFQSISIEISLLNNSLIIVGNLIGQEQETLRLILNQEKTMNLLNESFNDWEVVGKRIFVQKNQSGTKKLKIAPMRQIFQSILQTNDHIEKIESNQINQGNYRNKLKEDKMKQLTLSIRQKQFIKRNYYSIVCKKDITSNSTSEKWSSINNESNKVTINHQQKVDPLIFDLKHDFQKQNRKLTNNVKRNFINQTKNLDYMSTEMRDKVRKIKEEKERSLTKQKLEEQKLHREEFIKRQNLLVERLSKSKQAHKPIESTQLFKNPKTQSKQKSIIAFKVSSRKSLAIQPANKQAKRSSQYKLETKLESNIQIESKQPMQQMKKKESQSEFQLSGDIIQKRGANEMKQMKIKQTASVKQLIHQESDEFEDFEDSKSGQETKKVQVINGSLLERQRIHLQNISMSKGEQMELKKGFDQGDHNLARRESSSELLGEQSYSESESQPKKAHDLIKKAQSCLLKPIDRSESQQYESLIPAVEEQYQVSYEQFMQEKSPVIQHLNKHTKLQQIDKIDNEQPNQDDYEQEFDNQPSDKNSEKFQEAILDSVYSQTYEKDFQSSKGKPVGEEYQSETSNNQAQIQKDQQIQEEFIQ